MLRTLTAFLPCLRLKFSTLSLPQDLKKYMDDFAAARKAKDPSATGGLPECLAKSYLRQLMEGIHYCHSHRVLHR
jgi:serine/threonine protein kinase